VVRRESAAPLAAGVGHDEEQRETVLHIAARLRDAVSRVTLDEFLHQESRYDRDCRLGRELLYLASHHRWNRGTTEIVELDAADSVETTLQIKVDLGRVAHEAFRDKVDTVWLPLVLLPPPRTPGGAQEGQRRLTPSLEVRDASGDMLPALPPNEARRWMAAALAEIILNMAWAPVTEPVRRPAATREQRLLLSAAVQRVLRDGAPEQGAAVRDDSWLGGRMEKARRALQGLLEDFVGAVEVPLHEATPQRVRAALLIRRAALIVHAVSSPTTLVVIPVAPHAGPSVFTVRVPTRALHGSPRGRWTRLWTRLFGPRARLMLDVLLPSGDTDREVIVRLPDGVSHARRGDGAIGDASIEVSRPRCVRQLEAVMDQIDQLAPHGPTPARTDARPELRCLVDFAMARLEVVRDVFRHHRTVAAEASRGDPSGAEPPWLDDLASRLRGVDTSGAVSWDAIRAAWSTGRQGSKRLFRVLECDALSPRSLHMRAPLVENRAIRASSLHAHVFLDVAVDESAPLHVARYSGAMSLIILAAVGLNLLAFGSNLDAQVLAGVLTLFAVIQASRVEHPDRSTLRGLLTAASSWVILASILPTVLLGVTIAFKNGHPAWPLREFVVGALVGQLALQTAMFVGPLSGQAATSRTPRIVLHTKPAADYARIEVLHSSWWRSTTAGALLLGRPAHGYVLVRGSREMSRIMGDVRGSGPRPQNPRALARRGLATSVTAFARWLGAEGGVLNAVTSAPDGSPSLTGDAGAGLFGPGAGEVFSLAAPGTGSGTRTARDGGDPGTSEALATLAYESARFTDVPANILAMLIAGTAARALTFVVFREEPHEQWRRENGALPVDLDADRLMAHETPIGVVDIFVGLPVEHTPSPADHPVTRVLEAARYHERLVMEVQLPVPAPNQGARDLRWMRVRCGQRGDEFTGLAEFLQDVHRAVRGGGPAEVELLVDVTRRTPARRFLGRPAETSHSPVSARELDVVADQLAVTGASPTGQDWLVCAVCGYARTGVEADVLRQVSARHPGVRVVGLTTALLHGTVVVFFLGHRVVTDPEREPSPGARDVPGGQTAPAAQPSPAAPTVTGAQPAPGGQAPPAAAEHPEYQWLVEQWTDASVLGTLADGDADAEAGLLLRAHTQTSDRPGTFTTILERMADSLAAGAGVDPAAVELPIWYVHTSVVDGRLATSRFTVRLPARLARVGDGDTGAWEQAERAVRRALVSRSEELGAVPGGVRRDGQAVVSIQVVTAPQGDREPVRDDGTRPGTTDRPVLSGSTPAPAGAQEERETTIDLRDDSDAVP